MTTDEEIAAFEAFEFEGASILTPRDYAKLRGIAPQRVYYFIRTGRLPQGYCGCGRKVVNVQQADKVFATYARDVPEGIEKDGQEQV